MFKTADTQTTNGGSGGRVAGTSGGDAYTN